MQFAAAEPFPNRTRLASGSGVIGVKESNRNSLTRGPDYLGQSSWRLAEEKAISVSANLPVTANPGPRFS
jgi:hypothetical protein